MSKHLPQPDFKVQVIYENKMKREFFFDTQDEANAFIERHRNEGHTANIMPRKIGLVSHEITVSVGKVSRDNNGYAVPKKESEYYGNEAQSFMPRTSSKVDKLTIIS